MIRSFVVACSVVSLVGVLALASGCSSTPADGADQGTADDGQENVGETAQKVDSICKSAPVASIDGIPAYAYCGNFDVWSNNGVDVQTTKGAGAGWVQSEAGYGYQCFELAARYMHFKWGVSADWGVLYASQMCTMHPAGVTVTKKPVHGDLIVFAGGSCGIAAPAGHVAVVDTVKGTAVTAVQQNVAATVTWQQSCASCFLHATANGSDDPCGSAADGFFCAASPQFEGGKKGDFYECRGGVTKSKVTCAGGCEVSPPGVADICHQGPAGVADSGAPSEDASVPSDGGSNPPPQDAAKDGAKDAAAEQPSSGCSISSRGSGASSSWLFLAAAAIGAVVARRRTRTRSDS